MTIDQNTMDDASLDFCLAATGRWINADDEVFVRECAKRYPGLSRGELAEVFGAVADKLQGGIFGSPDGQVFDDGRTLAETFDDAAWAILSREDWPPANDEPYSPPEMGEPSPPEIDDDLPF